MTGNLAGVPSWRPDVQGEADLVAVDVHDADHPQRVVGVADDDLFADSAGQCEHGVGSFRGRRIACPVGTGLTPWDGLCDTGIGPRRSARLSVSFRPTAARI